MAETEKNLFNIEQMSNISDGTTKIKISSSTRGAELMKNVSMDKTKEYSFSIGSVKFAGARRLIYSELGDWIKTYPELQLLITEDFALAKNPVEVIYSEPGICKEFINIFKDFIRQALVLEYLLQNKQVYSFDIVERKKVEKKSPMEMFED